MNFDSFLARGLGADQRPFPYQRRLAETPWPEVMVPLTRPDPEALRRRAYVVDRLTVPGQPVFDLRRKETGDAA